MVVRRHLHREGVVGNRKDGVAGIEDDAAQQQVGERCALSPTTRHEPDQGKGNTAEYSPEDDPRSTAAQAGPGVIGDVPHDRIRERIPHAEDERGHADQAGIDAKHHVVDDVGHPVNGMVARILHQGAKRISELFAIQNPVLYRRSGQLLLRG